MKQENAVTEAMSNMPEDNQTNPLDGLPADASQREGNCLLLTLNVLRMLVPRNLVAEVVRFSYLRFTQDPRSGLQVFDWRGRKVPHLNHAVLGERQEARVDDDTKVAVFHGLRNRELLPYYGFTITGSPRLMRLNEGELEQIVDTPLHPGELMRIRLAENEAFIPKVDHFEITLIEKLNQHANGKQQ